VWRKKLKAYKSKLNKSGEPGIPEEWAREILKMAGAPDFPLDNRFGLLLLESNEDREEWQMMRVDTLPYSADLLEYTLKVLIASGRMDGAPKIPEIEDVIEDVEVESDEKRSH